jgi:hypothetical protein
MPISTFLHGSNELGTTLAPFTRASIAITLNNYFGYIADLQISIRPLPNSVDQ